MYITYYYDCTHNMKVCQYRYKKGAATAKYTPSKITSFYKDKTLFVLINA